jgi:hypothetical protein
MTDPNAYRRLKTDTDASNGLTFDGPLKFKPLRTLPGESKAWIKAASPLFFGSFYSAYAERSPRLSI